MQNNPLSNVLSNFDNVLIKKSYLLDYSNLEVAHNHDLIGLWREEIQAEKKSIYVIGKTSTGKSTFLNFLLDYDTKKTPLFKTSTKIETGVIQTLQHCESISSAHAILKILNIEQFKKNEFPSYCRYKDSKNELFFPLDTSERINYFRDEVIAKKDNKDKINIISTVKSISIKFPLKYFKNYKIVDTPGLDSSITQTDEIVKKNFNGKSFILWFINGSNRNISDDLVLLDKSKSLFNNFVMDLHFIVNQFDNADYDFDGTNEEVTSRKNEIYQKISNYLEVNLNSFQNNYVYFSSFKNPNKKFAGLNTFKEVERLEFNLLAQYQDQYYKNIKYFIDVLRNQLNIIINILNSELNSVINEIRADVRKKQLLDKKQNESKHIFTESLDYINNLKNEMITIEKCFDKIKNRTLFNNYLSDLNKSIEKYSKRISDSIKRIDLNSNANFEDKLKMAKQNIEISFDNNENVFKKFIWDKELKKNKVKLSNSIQLKMEEFFLVSTVLERDIQNHFFKIKELIRNDIETKELKRIKYDDSVKEVKLVLDKTNSFKGEILSEVEQEIDSWKINESFCSLENFIQIYALTEKHVKIKNIF